MTYIKTTECFCGHYVLLPQTCKHNELIKYSLLPVEVINPTIFTHLLFV